MNKFCKALVRRHEAIIDDDDSWRSNHLLRGLRWVLVRLSVVMTRFTVPISNVFAAGLLRMPASYLVAECTRSSFCDDN
jgi:hypothetical protein